MARRKGKKTGRVLNIAKTGVAVNAIIQMVEPFISRNVIAAAQQAVEAKDLTPLVQVFKEGSKEAFSFGNLIQTLGPGVGLKVAQYVVGSGPALSLKKRGRITGVRAF